MGLDKKWNNRRINWIIISNHTPHASNHLLDTFLSINNLSWYSRHKKIVAWTLKRNNESKINNRIIHDYQINWIQKYTMNQPLPQKLMTLSGINLKQHFVGWLSKVGVQFLGIIYSLYRVWKNAISWSMLERVENMNIIQGLVELISLAINTVRKNATTIITKMIVNHKTFVRGLTLYERSMFDWELPT